MNTSSFFSSFLYIMNLSFSSPVHDIPIVFLPSTCVWWTHHLFRLSCMMILSFSSPVHDKPNLFSYTTNPSYSFPSSLHDIFITILPSSAWWIHHLRSLFLCMMDPSSSFPHLHDGPILPLSLPVILRPTFIAFSILILSVSDISNFPFHCPVPIFISLVLHIATVPFLLHLLFRVYM